jgi:hypothetical protein
LGFQRSSVSYESCAEMMRALVGARGERSSAASDEPTTRVTRCRNGKSTNSTRSPNGVPFSTRTSGAGGRSLVRLGEAHGRIAAHQERDLITAAQEAVAPPDEVHAHVGAPVCGSTPAG